MDRLLVDGYVRTIEKSLTEQIIPIDIYHICFDFYFSTKFIFYLASTKSGADDIDQIQNTMSVTNIDSKHQWNCNVSQLSNPNINVLDTKDSPTECKWLVDNAAICFARNVKLPAKVHTALHRNAKFNYVVFQCGGIPQSDSYTRNPVNACNALIINSYDFQQRGAAHITVHQWSLPPFPNSIAYNYALYSSVHHALFSVGGAESSDEGEEFDYIQKLSFLRSDNANEEEWHWQQLAVKMEQKKSGVCATFLDSNHSKVMVAGGFTEESAESSQLNTVEILDLLATKAVENVTPMKLERMDAGILFDEMKNVCYVGGGYNGEESAQRSVEYLDCVKNVWYQLPETKTGHDMNPLLWLEESNLLHIMSIKGNGIETIDLRDAKQWNVRSSDLEKEFNVKFDVNNVTCSRIVGN